MPELLAAIRTRILPAALMSLGIVLIAAGLLSYTDPATAGAALEASPTIEDLSPDPGPTMAPSLPVPPSPTGSALPSPTDGPSTSPAPRAYVTRVVVPALNIDLPVVAPPSGYPLCNVAMYIQELGQPGEGRATYIYAHARDGMFGPIYELAHAGKQRRMLGMLVQVYTDDNKLYLYEIRQVRVHQTSLDAALKVNTEQLWLQTSEGPKGTPGKTQLIARPLSVGAADPTDAHPRAKPVVCG
jgi:sortase (surface protein transpeptidase)